jgi:Tfp pilus assembly protein PilX
VRSRLADERGLSLVLALLVVGVLTITTATVAQMVTTNEHFFGRDKQETLAFNTAEAGVNYAISTLAQTVDATGSLAAGATYGSSTAPNAYPTGTGSGGWWAVKVQKVPYGIWQVYGTGTSPTGQVIREVSVKVKTITQPGEPVPSSTAWTFGLFVGNPGASCFTPTGTADLTISIYVKGCIDLSGNVGIVEPSSSSSPSVKIYAETTLKFSSGSAQIGASTKRVYSVIAPGGCTGKSGNICSAGSPPGSTSKVYATYYTGPSQNIPKPPVYPDAEYAKGDWANPSCTTGSFTFDDNATRDTSVGTVDLFPSSSYDCKVWDSTHTAYVGRLAWDASTNVLTGSGLIYIDGDIHMNSNTAASYVTPGLNPGDPLGLALYVDGTVQMNGTASLCGPPSVPSGSSCTTPRWSASAGAIVLTTVNHQGANNPLAVGWNANGNSYYDLAAYVVGKYRTNGSSGITGPVICDTADVSGNGAQTDVSDPPPNSPGSSYTNPGATDWGVIPATWQQLKPS